MNILSIDTSCDETAAAVVSGRRVMKNVIYSQVLIHQKWGGVVPSLAKRAHEERIDFVIDKAVSVLKEKIPDAVAVTYGPGLAVALEVGIKKAKDLSLKYQKPLIGVNHLEGHIYSAFVKNSKGNPERDFEFPYLALVISGGHTEFVIFEDHLTYKVIGSTLDDAAGEAYDKAAKLLGLGYPGGAALERLAEKAGNRDYHRFPRPMIKSGDLNFSFSGLKTAFYYWLRDRSEEEKATEVAKLCSSFQEAVADTLMSKTRQAIKSTGIKKLIVGGGVSANRYLRKRFRALVKDAGGQVLFPSYPYLTGDNAAMIGVVASFYADKGRFVKNSADLDRVPRLSL